MLKEKEDGKRSRIKRSASLFLGCYDDWRVSGELGEGKRDTNGFSGKRTYEGKREREKQDDLVGIPPPAVKSKKTLGRREDFLNSKEGKLGEETIRETKLNRLKK